MSFVFAFIFTFLSQANQPEFYVFDKMKKSCRGYNVTLGECFSNRKIRSIQGTFESLKLNGSKMIEIKIQQSRMKNCRMDSVQMSGGTVLMSQIDGLIARESNFAGVRWASSKIFRFNMVNSNLNGAKISRSQFVDGDLRGVSFKHAMITDSVFRRVSLSKSMMQEARLINVKFEDVRWY